MPPSGRIGSSLTHSTRVRSPRSRSTNALRLTYIPSGPAGGRQLKNTRTRSSKRSVAGAWANSASHGGRSDSACGLKTRPSLRHRSTSGELVVRIEPGADGVQLVEHQDVDDRQRRDEGPAELHILERQRLEEVQLDPAGREVLPGVELDAADGVDVRGRAERLAEREHLVLPGESVVDRHRRGHPDPGLEPEVRRGADQRIVEEGEQVALGVTEDVLEQWTRLRVERRLAVRPSEPGEQRRRLVRVGDLALADVQVVRGLGERD